MPPDKGKRASGKRIAVLIVTALTLVFIFVQSVLPRTVSAKESGWLTEKILNPALRLFGLGPVGHSAVRKIAHVLEFLMLSLLLTICFRGDVFKSAGTGFTAAFLDESVQLLSGRGASVRDVWIDLIGVALGTMLGFLLRKAMSRSREEAASVDGETQTEERTETYGQNE